MSNDNENKICDLLKRIQGKQLRACEVGMLHYNGITDNETLANVVNGLYDIIKHDSVIVKCSSVLQVLKTEHGVNVYAKPCKARVFGFKCASNCEVASIVAKRLGSLFPEYTTDTTKTGGFCQHRLAIKGRPTSYKYLTMVSPALLIHEGFNGVYRKQKIKSKVLETYKGLD